MNFLPLLICLSTVFGQLEASAAYCDSEFCSGPDKYCCGHNECCNYGYTSWYLWLALVTGLVIIGLVIWKCITNKRRLIDSPRGHSASKSPLTESSSSSQLGNHDFMYMPLSNNEIFTESHIDENTIQFNLVKSLSNIGDPKTMSKNN